jgi:hypothetical protein
VHMHTRFLSLANIHMCVLMICKIKVDVNHSVEEGVFCFWGCSSFTRKRSKRDDVK